MAPAGTRALPSGPASARDHEPAPDPRASARSARPADTRPALDDPDGSGGRRYPRSRWPTESPQVVGGGFPSSVKSKYDRLLMGRGRHGRRCADVSPLPTELRHLFRRFLAGNERVIGIVVLPFGVATGEH